MTAADGVAELLEVGGEPGGIQALYQVHPLAVQALQPIGNTLEEVHAHVCCRLYWFKHHSVVTTVCAHQCCGSGSKPKSHGSATLAHT